MSDTKIYGSWERMKDRCNNPGNKSYHDYGGRGISIIKEWNDRFLSFYDYVKKLPNYMKEGYTLDRIDNDKGYEPGNLRWATYSMQSSNRRWSSSSGYTGVSYVKRDDKYSSELQINRKRIVIGYFDTAEEAATERNKYISANNIEGYELQQVKTKLNRDIMQQRIFMPINIEEAPEYEGEYLTDKGELYYYFPDEGHVGWCTNELRPQSAEYPNYWMKPVRLPSEASIDVMANAIIPPSFLNKKSRIEYLRYGFRKGREAIFTKLNGKR